MQHSSRSISQIVLAYEDRGGAGDPPVILLPGAGDLAWEYREMAGALEAAGWRVVLADLPGHGDSPPAPSYGVSETADALAALMEQIDAGPVVVVATSFAPAAAAWLAAEHPGIIRGLVAISPHMTAEPSVAATLQRWVISALLRGPWAAGLWVRLYRSWFKSVTPQGFEEHLDELRSMLSDPVRRRAVRETLTAGRDGVAPRLERLDIPSLVMFGSADDHFADPVAEASELAATMGAEQVIIDGAGHYPHVEQPGIASGSILEFLDSLGPIASGP